MHTLTSFFTLLALLVVFPLVAQAPYNGTIFVDSDIITSADPTEYTGIASDGTGMRTVYDRRTASFNTILCHLFTLTFSDGTTIESQVNTEFTTQEAQDTSAYFGTEVGRLPRVLRRDIDALWIHKGNEPFGGGNRSILIHTDQSASYIQNGILEETLVHEASHTSLDGDHAAAAGWVAAQDADPEFISTYAEDNPTREDIAESFLMWLAVRHRSATISQTDYDNIVDAIPNRLAYFDAQNFDLAPLPSALPVTLISFDAAAEAKQVQLKWRTEQEVDNRGFGIERSTDARSWFSIGFVPAMVQGDGGNYKFQDTSPVNGANYYRLRQEDFDGTMAYSDVKVVKFTTQALVIFPNPASDVAVIQWPEPIDKVEGFVFTDLGGATTAARVSRTGDGIQIAVGNLPAGVYLMSGLINGTYIQERIVVNR